VNKFNDKFEEANGGGEVFLKLNSAFNHLGRAEKQVATFIKNYPEEVTKLPINIFAEKVGVSVSTIIRVCKRIGIEGYSDLKFKLVKDIALNYKKTYAEIDSNDSISTLLKKAEKIYKNTISDTFKLLSKKELLKAAELIIKARTILIVGVGGTSSISRLLNHKLLKLEINTQFSGDINVIPLLLNKMDKSDLLFTISHSGSTNDVYDAIEIAVEQNCNIITLTNYFQSPMAKISDVVLTTAVNEEPLGSEGGTTRLSQISVIEILCLIVTLKKQHVF